MRYIKQFYGLKTYQYFLCKKCMLYLAQKISLYLMMKNTNAFIGIITLTLFITSCKDDYSICNPVRDVKFTGGFYKRVAATDVPSPAPNFSLSLINNISLVYNNQPNVIEFGVPLNELADTSKYVLSLDNGQPKDTLTIVYSSQRSTTDGNACGIVTYHNISQVYSTTNTIDSIKLIQPLVNTSQVQNAKIYF